MRGHTAGGTRRTPDLLAAVLTPAEVQTFLDRDRLDTVDRLVGDKSDAGIKEVLAGRGFGLHALINPALDGLDTERGHKQRILLTGRPDHTSFDVLDTGAATIDRHDQNIIFAPLKSGGLNCLL